MKNYLTQLLFRNFGYKIAALVLAGFFWWIVQGEEVMEITRRLHVNILVDEGLMVRGQLPIAKDITLRGPRVLLGDYSNRPLEATIRVPKAGQTKIRLSPELIDDLDTRIKATIHDPYINVPVEEKLGRRIPVIEVIKGVPADGYIIEKVTIDPPQILVTGLKSDVSKIQELRTRPVDVSGLQQSKTFEAEVTSDEFDKEWLATTNVTVSVQIGEKKVNKSFSQVQVDATGSEYQTSVRPKSVSIVIQGTPGILNFVKKADLGAFVEVRELSPGRYQKDIQVKIPPDTVLIETIPSKATVEIYNQKIGE